MTMSTHGIREGSKQDQPDEAKAKAREKEKEKAEEAIDSSGQDEKEKARAEEKAALTWWEKKDMKMNGKKKKNRMTMTAIGPKNKNGTMSIGAQKNCTTRMSMVCSREKEKVRKARKERKEKTMKDKANQEMARASQTMCSHPLHGINQFKINLNRFITQVLFSSNTGHGFVSFAETDPVRVDVLDATYHEQRTRRNRRAGQNVRDARAELNKERMQYDPVHVGQLGAGAYRPEVRFPVLEGDVDTLRQGLRRRPLPPGLHERPLQPGLQPEEEGTSFFTHGDSEQSEIPVDMKVGDSSQEEKPSQCECSEQSEESSEKDCAFSFHTNPVDACEKGLAFHMENSAPPTVCILDLGCTRAMGSRKAVDAFCRYVGSHPNSGLWYVKLKILLCELSTIKM